MKWLVKVGVTDELAEVAPVVNPAGIRSKDDAEDQQPDRQAEGG